MEIIKQHLKRGQFFDEDCKKQNIVYHHTVSSTAGSALTWWDMTPVVVATAFLIGKDGAIFEAFPPGKWAHALGLRNRRNVALNKRAIQIELVNEGPLIEVPGYTSPRWNFGPTKPHGSPYRGEVIATKPWRGFSLWAAYTEEQYRSLSWLTRKLCDEFNIQPTMCTQDVCNLSVPDRFGIYTHAQVRADKSDLHPGFDWKKIIL